MKTLILIRHAKSCWDNPSLEDFLRPLNKRGKKDAPLMAQKLKDKQIIPDLIISSPSIRTEQTLGYFLEKFNSNKKVIFDENIYEAPYENLLQIIRQIDNLHKTIFLIGHNPGLNNLVNSLIDNFINNIPTTGIVRIDFDTGSWKEINRSNSKLIFFEYPKMFL